MSRKTKARPHVNGVSIRPGDGQIPLVNGERFAAVPAIVPADPIRIDLGSGPNKRPGFLGVDRIAFPGVDVVCNLGADRWPWDDGTVDEAHASHFLEHLTNFQGRWERIHFFNEVFRVLKPGAPVKLIFPHWCSQRYYGDPTHCEPFSEMAFLYLNKEWRMMNAPHTDKTNNPNGYDCDLIGGWAYNIHPAWTTKEQSVMMEATNWYKEVVMDIDATLNARKG